jgi:hypothetical protein
MTRNPLKGISWKYIVLLAFASVAYVAAMAFLLYLSDPEMTNDAADNKVGFWAGVGFIAIWVMGFLLVRRKS